MYTYSLKKMDVCANRIVIFFLGEPCYKAANNSPGTCISMRSCTPYVNLLKEHGTKVGPFLRSTVCYFDGNNPVVCCPPFNGPSNPPTIATDPPYQTEPTTQSYGGGFDFQTCGISKAQHNRVVGGVPSALGKVFLTWKF